jgi:hypothetical protein
MKKTLDFNRIQRPTLELIMCDEARTVINVTTPSEELVEKMVANLPELEAAAKRNDAESIRSSYILAAEIISCNLEGITVTAEELRDKYKMKLDYAILFFNAYLDFVHDIQEAKN